MTLQREHAPETTHGDMADIRELTGVIQNLISMMATGNIGSLKLEYGALRLSLRSNDPHAQRETLVAYDSPRPVEQAREPREDPPQTSGHFVTAPMIGTFYVAPAPNEPPFVSPGDLVEEGQTIGIIEAMKIMNEIAADRSGTIVEIVAGDGQTVEYGSPLVRIDSADE